MCPWWHTQERVASYEFLVFSGTRSGTGAWGDAAVGCFFLFLNIFFKSLYWTCYNIASVLWFFGHEACGLLAPGTSCFGRSSVNLWTTREVLRVLFSHCILTGEPGEEAIQPCTIDSPAHSLWYPRPAWKADTANMCLRFSSSVITETFPTQA